MGLDNRKPDTPCGLDSTRGDANIGESKSRGADRAATYSSNWPTADLNDAISKFAGSSPEITVTDKGKKIFTNTGTGIEVVVDMEGSYFRILDTNLTGRRVYLDLDGNIPNNKLVDGKQIGRNQSEYNQVTHFNIKKDN